MRPRTRMGICTLEDFYLPISGQAIVMEKQRNKVCGADIHKKFLVATIVSRDGIKINQTIWDDTGRPSGIQKLGRREPMRASSSRVHESVLDSNTCGFRGYNKFDS